MFAIVEMSGFQEKVTEGEKLSIPLQDAAVGAKVVFDRVLLISKGDTVTLGKPTVDGAKVEVTVLGHGKEDTIRVYKMRRRKRYRRTQGHRQQYTEVEVTKISA